MTKWSIIIQNLEESLLDFPFSGETAQTRSDITECIKFRRSRAIVPLCLPGPEIFSCGYFVAPKVFLVGISWVQNFFSCIFCGSNFFFVADFIIQRFSVAGCTRKSDKKWK